MSNNRLQHEHSRRPRHRLPLIAALMLGVSVLPGCAGPFKRLPDVDQVPELAALRSEGEPLRRALRRVPVAEGEGREPVRLALEEVGSRDSDRVLVMIHGALSDRRAWGFMASDLGRDHTLLLIDLLGCGDSDRPDPATMEPDGYSPTAQARRVLQALRTYVDGRERSTRLTLVAHSLGGAVVLRMTGDPQLRDKFADVIDRIDSVVLFAPLDIAVEKADPRFVKVTRLGRSKVWLASTLGLLRKEAALTTINGYVDPGIATKEDARRLLQILRRRETRRPAQAMIVQAVPFDPKKQTPQWERIEQKVADYKNVDIPCLIVWGSRDETLPTSMGYKLRAQLPQAWLRIVSESKHSLPRERPRQSSSLVREFVAAGGRGWSRVEQVRPEPHAESAEGPRRITAWLGALCSGTPR